MGRKPPPAVRVETRPLDSLTPAAYNPRRISDAALAGLRASMKRFGVVQPIIVNDRTGSVVGGHQRLRVLVEDGATEAQVVVVDLPPGEERALNVALNNPHTAGEFTDDLQSLLDSIRTDDAGLFEALNFGPLTIAALAAPDGFPGVDPGAVGAGLDHECPRCGFRFE